LTVVTNDGTLLREVLDRVFSARYKNGVGGEETLLKQTKTGICADPSNHGHARRQALSRKAEGWWVRFPYGWFDFL